LIYPGTVFFEATNLNEGRGTDAPLKQAGAPWLTDAPAIAQMLNGLNLKGVRFEARQVEVKAGDKHGGQTIPVVRLHVTDKNAFEPVAAAVHLMRMIFLHHPTEWAWQRGNGAERLSGTAQFRAAVSDTNRSSTGVRDLLARWQKESAAFQQEIRPYLIY